MPDHPDERPTPNGDAKLADIIRAHQEGRLLFVSAVWADGDCLDATAFHVNRQSGGTIGRVAAIARSACAIALHRVAPHLPAAARRDMIRAWRETAGIPLGLAEFDGTIVERDRPAGGAGAEGGAA